MTLSLLALAAPAHAIIIAGNPDLDFHVQRLTQDLDEGLGHLDKVRIVECGTLDYTDYAVGEDIDPVVGFSLTIAGGDLCGAVLYWTGDVQLKGTNGNGAFRLDYGDATTVIPFADPIEAVVLTPIEVVYGTPGGTNPRLYATVQ